MCARVCVCVFDGETLQRDLERDVSFQGLFSGSLFRKRMGIRILKDRSIIFVTKRSLFEKRPCKET